MKHPSLEPSGTKGSSWRRRLSRSASPMMIFAVILVPVLIYFFILQSTKKTSLKTPTDKQSYALGYTLGTTMDTKDAELTTNSLAKGLVDALSGAEPALDEVELNEALQSYYEHRRKRVSTQHARQKELTADHFTSLSSQGLKKTPSGMYYEEIQPGDGFRPTESDLVLVNFRATLISGDEIDSTYVDGAATPRLIPVQSKVKGWTEALQMMRKGSRWRFHVPPNLAFGSQGRPNIPPDSGIIYDIELLEIQSP